MDGGKGTNNYPIPAVIEESPDTYLAFRIDACEYGLNIDRVQEITDIAEVIAIPGVPEYVRGVLDLRGEIIPVMDLRVKFGMEVKDDTEKTCVIVVRVNQGIEWAVIGVVVDEIFEMVNRNNNGIEPAISTGENVDRGFASDSGRIGDTIMLTLNIDGMLREEDWT